MTHLYPPASHSVDEKAAVTFCFRQHDYLLQVCGISRATLLKECISYLSNLKFNDKRTMFSLMLVNDSEATSRCNSLFTDVNKSSNKCTTNRCRNTVNLYFKEVKNDLPLTKKRTSAMYTVPLN